MDNRLKLWIYASYELRMKVKTLMHNIATRKYRVTNGIVPTVNVYYYFVI